MDSVEFFNSPNQQRCCTILRHCNSAVTVYKHLHQIQATRLCFEHGTPLQTIQKLGPYHMTERANHLLDFAFFTHMLHPHLLTEKCETPVIRKWDSFFFFFSPNNAVVVQIGGMVYTNLQKQNASHCWFAVAGQTGIGQFLVSFTVIFGYIMIEGPRVTKTHI